VDPCRPPGGIQTCAAEPGLPRAAGVQRVTSQQLSQPRCSLGSGLHTFCRVTAPLGSSGGKAGRSVPVPPAPARHDEALRKNPLRPVRLLIKTAGPATPPLPRPRGERRRVQRHTPRLLRNGSGVLALTVSFMGALHATPGQPWDAIV